ncbi:MAG TPA: hypothetical protein VIE36_25355 [Methylomirabilota bacterium]|jgi:hypothetical protein
MLKPTLALVFFLGFGGFFVFGGFQSATLELHRSAAGGVDGTLTRSHFFGLYTVSTELRTIRRAVIDTGTSHPRPGIALVVSGVALESDSGKTRIFSGLSNVDEAYKREIARTVNQYLSGRDNRSFQETFTIRNMFGWVGLPFLLVGIYGALMWPISTVRARRVARENP